jgi:hypothetical protein
VRFDRLEMHQMGPTQEMMRGPLPIVFVAGAAATNPSLNEVLDAYRRRVGVPGVIRP